nr:hypothetical protein [Tanacetum cinerariifolium]
MVAILEKIEHNIDFHQIVDFLKASHIRYALTISPTIYVSHIRQFWSNARIETTYQETKIIATVDVSKPKNTGFNEFSSNIATAVVCFATNRVYNFSKIIFDGMGKGSANPTELHHTPSPQEHHSPQHDSSPPSHQTIISEPIPQTSTKTLTPRRLTRRAIWIAQSKAPSPAADEPYEPASLLRDDRQGEAFPTVSSLDAGQDRENIAKTSAMPHESSSRVPSFDADEGRKKTCRAYSRGCSNHRGIKDIREELGADKSIELGSNDTEEMINVLSSMEAVNILLSGGAAASVSPADVFPIASVPTVSGSFPTVSVIFTTASVVTPYTRRSRGITIGSLQPTRIPIIRAKDKGKEKVIETEVSKKRKLHEQIDAQVAREMEEEFARENQRLSLDRSNEVIAKHLSEYDQAEADLSVGEKIDMISEMVKYQDHRAKILKYQAQQSKPLSKKEKREFYMSVLRCHVGWKTKHFRGMTLGQLKEKFILVKHPIIDCEIHSEGKREYWKIIRLGGHTAVYQFFVDMLKQFDREDLHQLWTLVKKTFSIKQATRDKEKELWVELKRLFESDFKDQL